MSRWLTRCLLTVSLIIGLWTLSEQKAAAAEAPDTVVRAVLFYSPTSGDCHYIICDVLPPLYEEYGDRLQILGVDVSQLDAQTLFMAVLSKFELERGGMPMLVMGDTCLISSVDIQEQLPGLIEQHLAQGGLDWPNIRSLDEMVSASIPAASGPPVLYAPDSAAPAPGVPLTVSKDTSLSAPFSRDLTGNTLAVIVLVVMVTSAVGGTFFQPASRQPYAHLWKWSIPILCVIGLAVASYLAYVEVTQTEIVCGPVGDCNAARQSTYARLFDVLPISVIGVIGYIAILGAWGVSRYGQGKPAALAAAVMLGMTAFGLLFSIYLTFLGAFVIGATCAWCLASAVLMTVLFWFSLTPGRSALPRLLQRWRKKQNCF